MAYEDYGYDPMGNATGYVDQEAQAIALREEEEKKRKEAEERARKENEKLAKERDNLAVHKQEVTTYANGSKTITNVAEIPATANAPGRPNVKPVAPDDIFQNQLRAESGNRQNNRNGQIMTSPKGALGIAQIMPSTAMQPGYGVPDIFTMAQQRGIEVPDRSEATAKQLLANKDLNQAFGQQYSSAMRNRFGDSAGVAAYNAGPGAVERNMGRNQGQFNVAQAPQETQGYLDKVMRGVGNVVNAVIPSAQAGTLQQPPANVGSSGFQAYDRNRPGNAAYEGAPVAPSFQGQTDEFGGMEEPRQAPTAPISPEAVDNTPIPTAGGVGIRMPGQPLGVPSSAGAIETYQQHQDNIPELMKLGISDDPNVPDYIKERSRNRAADLVQQQREMEKAKQQVATMTPTETAKALRKKSDEGSFVKMFVYSMLGMSANANEEADKLGMGRETAVMGADGKPYLIKVGYNGKPLSGYNPETSKDLTNDELIKVAAGATDMKNTKAHMMAEGKGSPVTKTINGELINGLQIYDPVRKTFYVQYGNKRDEDPKGWTSASQNVEQQAVLGKQKAQIDLYKKFEGANIDAKFKYIEDTNKALVKEFGASAPVITPEEMGLSRPGAGGRVEAVPPTPLPAGTQGATVAPAGGPVPPSQLPTTQASSVPATTAGGQRPTLGDLERQKETQKVERELGQKSSEGVIKHRDEKLVPAAMAGQEGSDSVKRQFKLINDPTSDVLFGLYNKAQSNSTKDKNWAIVRDWLGGKLDPNDQTQISKAIAAVKLDSNEQAMADLYLQETTKQANAAVKSGVYGQGNISNADRISAEKAQLDITTTPALAVFAGKGQQLFGFDISRAKSDWAVGKKFEAVDQLEKAWRQEETKLVEQYGKVADERNAFIKANSDNKPATIGLVRKAYQMYPVPQYDPNLNSGNGGWRNMRDRKLNDILKGNQ